MARIRVLIADDHALVRTRVAEMLSADCDVVAVVGDGLAAFDAAVVLKPDVVVLDISMPILCGFDVASRLVACGRAPRIIFLTVHEDVEYLDAARRVGALGYVLKRHIGTDLIPAIAAVLEGRQAFPPHPGSTAQAFVPHNLQHDRSA
jgi:DNA-binding NarL/FixJ family response regulator